MMKVAVLVENQYQVLEVWYPYLRLREEGIETVFVGTGKKSYLSKEGYPAQEELEIQKADPTDFDGVIIPGGFAPDHMRRHPEVAAFIRKMHDQGKLVAAICHGPWMLASADVLRGKKATSFFAIQDDIRNAGADWVDEEVVVDGNVITSRNPYDLPAFMQACIHFLKKS